MKNLLKTSIVVNYTVRWTLASCAGAFLGSVMRLAIMNEQKMADKIAVAAGGLVTSYVVGNALDAPFNKMLEEGEAEEIEEIQITVRKNETEEMSEA